MLSKQQAAKQQLGSHPTTIRVASHCCVSCMLPSPPSPQVINTCQRTPKRGKKKTKRKPGSLLLLLLLPFASFLWLVLLFCPFLLHAAAATTKAKAATIAFTPPRGFKPKAAWHTFLCWFRLPQQSSLLPQQPDKANTHTHTQTNTLARHFF